MSDGVPCRADGCNRVLANKNGRSQHESSKHDQEFGKYTNEAWLREQYWGERKTLDEMANECEASRRAIISKMKEYDIERRDVGGSDKDAEYRDKEWLDHKYNEEGLNTYDMADEADCSPTAIRTWMDKCGIEREGRGHNSKAMPPCHMYKNGYEVVENRHRDESFVARIHKLVAIADGADPHTVFDGHNVNVHHKNGIPWDNRPENIEVLSVEEHARLHGNETKFWEYREGVDE